MIMTTMKTITLRTKEPVVVIPVEEYESMKETIEILSDSATMKRIEKSMQEFRAGKFKSMEEVKKSLRL